MKRKVCNKTISVFLVIVMVITMLPTMTLHASAEDVPTKVILGNGSLGTADDSKITGLTSEKIYMVTVDPEGTSKIMYTMENGTLTENAEDKAALGENVTEITGLTNGTTYKVEEYTLAEASLLTVTIAPGTANGSTKVTITESATSKFVVNITDDEVTTPNVEDSIPTGDNIINPYTSGNDISTGVTANKWLQVYDVDNDSKVVGFYQKQLTAEDIKTVTEEEQANQAIESAKNLIPESFTAEEGTHTNLLDYLDGIENMSKTGVTLSLDASGNDNVDDDGTITYTDSQITGNVTVKINKTGGTEQIKVISITIPKHVSAVASQLDVTIVPGTANGSTKVTISENATSKFVVNITDSEVPSPNVEDSIPTGDNIINPYTSGNDITTGVIENKWLQVYDVDANEKVVRFYQKQLTSEDININIIETTGDWADVAGLATSEGDNPDYQISQDEKTYTIKTAKGLAWLAHQVNNGTNDFTDKTVELANDIDLMEHFWTPIGIDSKNSFKGIFDGKGYTISNLKIGTKANPNEDMQYIGLFGYVNGSTIQDISIVECAIYSSKENVYAGSLVGLCVSGTVKNSYATGTIECSGVLSIAGGLIGCINGCKIMNSYSTNNIKGSSKVGGLIGYSLTSIIINSYATGYVECSDGESGIAGGLVGSSYGISDKIINCYATGDVEGSGEVGGLLGKSNYDVVTNGYWNNELNDKGVGDGYDSTTGLSSTNMGKDNQSKGIDFAKTLNENQSSIEDLDGISLVQWGIDVSKNNGYPIFTGIGEGIGVVPVLIANVTRGKAEGSTKATITGDAASKFVVDITDNIVNIPKLGDNVSIYGEVVDDYKSEDDVITGVLAGKWLQIYDVDSDYKVVKFYQEQLTKEDVSIGSWADVVGSATSEGDNPDYQISQDGKTYTIRTSKGLAWLAYQVNNGINDFTDKTVELANDIDIGEHFWIPIGIDSDNSFNGIFDGKGYVISNLKIGMKERPDVDTNIKYMGLFGYAYEATIKDVGIEECAIYSAKDSTYIGGLVGYSYNNTITNSYTTGTIENSGEDCDMGGLAGYSNGTIDNSYTIGTIENSGEDSDVGGLAGYSNGTIDNSYTSGTVKSSGNLYKPYVGGLVGHGKGSITNCYVTGCVEGNGKVGGLVGFVHFCSVNNSYVSGDVTGNGSVGGLVGHGSGGSIINSYTTGNVTGGGHEVKVGGVVGECYSMIYNSHSSGNIIAGDGGYAGGLVGTNNAVGNFDSSSWVGRIVNSYATGDVTGGKEAWVGGLSGSCGGVIMNSYATGNITGGDISRVGGLAGYLTFAIMNSYTTGDVKGGENAFVGGVLGDSLKNIDGWNHTELNNVYWNSDAKQTVDSVDRDEDLKKGTGNSYMENKTTGKKKEEMQDKVPMEGVTFTWFLNYNQKDIELPQECILQEWGIDASKNNGYPILKALTYSVTYDGNGNTSGDAPIDSTKYEAEADVTVLGKGDLERTNYVFDGWNTESNESGDSYDSGQSFKMPASDLTLYAKWTDAHILEYIAGENGHIEGDSNQKVKYGENGTEVEAVPNEGYHFVSWSDGETTAKRTDNNVTKNVSVTANFEIDKYKVTFNTNGGSSISPSAIIAGYKTKVEKPTQDPTKTGYAFEGWYKWHEDSSLNTKWAFESDMVTEDMTLYAKWTPDNPNILTDDEVTIVDGVITRYTGTKTDIIIPSVLAGQTVTKIGAGVFQSSNLTNVEIPNSVTSIGIDAFQNNELISVTIPVSVKEIGEDAFDGQALPDGYEFKGWYEKPDLSGESFNFTAERNEDVTIYSYPHFNIIYEENGGSIVADEIILKGTYLTKPAKPTKVGYTFKSWYKDDNFNTEWDFEKDKVTSNMHLYAKWEANKYTITFNNNGGSIVIPPTITGEYDKKINKPTPDQAKAGYSFEGWYKWHEDSSLNTKWDFENDVVKGDMTLYAKWIPDNPNILTDDEVTVVHGKITRYTGTKTDIIIPSVLAGQQVTSIGKDVFKDKGLTSITIPNTVTSIEMSAFDGNKLISVIIPKGVTSIGEGAFDKQTLPDEYEFKGWFEKPDISGETFDFTAERSEDVTIYSYPHFNITYQENDGSAVAGEIVCKGTLLTEPTAPTKPGYTFAGWYTDNGFNTEWNFANDTVTGNITLYAKWTKISSGHSHNKNTSEDTVKAETDNGSIDIGEAKVNYNSDGKKETVLAIDKKDVENIVSKTKYSERVSIEVGKDTDVVKAQLNVQSIKDMQDKNLTLEVKTNGAIYDLSTSKVDIEDISNEIGEKVGLKDIKFSVQISKTNNDMAKVVKDTTNKGGLAIVAPPVDFNIEASYKDKTYKVDKFKGFISRKIEIPEGTDVSKITTAVIVEKDGSLRHVPTYVTKIDGKYYAQVNSLTNSTYTIIYNKKTFSDITDAHWAKDVIEKMASRMIVEGNKDGTFEPDKAITRAEYAKAIVRALGLAPTQIQKFTDVESGSDIAGYIGTAYSYGIINGVNENTFNPKGLVTRQDAMTMIYRASKIVDFTGKSDIKDMNNYIDYSKVSDYAKEAVEWNVDKNIIIGRTDNTLVPFDNITRAELCNVINKFLISAGLIE